MNETGKVICKTIYAVVAALVIGEVFGNCISRPIAAYRGDKIDPCKLTTLLQSMMDRITKLEEKKEEDEAE